MRMRGGQTAAPSGWSAVPGSDPGRTATLPGTGCETQLQGLGLRKAKAPSRSHQGWRAQCSEATPLKGLLQLPPEAACAQPSVTLTQVLLSFSK